MISCYHTCMEKQMKVYCVIGGYDYEGEDFKSLQLFDCKSTAEKYKKQLEDEFDYVLMEIKVVDMQSSIVAA